jgi:hypothetical protein
MVSVKPVSTKQKALLHFDEYSTTDKVDNNNDTAYVLHINPSLSSPSSPTSRDKSQRIGLFTELTGNSNTNFIIGMKPLPTVLHHIGCCHRINFVWCNQIATPASIPYPTLSSAFAYGNVLLAPAIFAIHKVGLGVCTQTQYFVTSSFACSPSLYTGCMLGRYC